MAKNFETSSDIGSDTGSEVGKNAGSDCGGELARESGLDLNKSNDSYGYKYGYDTDSTEGSAGNPFPSNSEYNTNKFTSGFSNEQHDLGNQLENPDTDLEKSGFSKAMEYAPPPTDYSTVALPQESAIYCDAPKNFGRSLEEKYPGLKITYEPSEDKLPPAPLDEERNRMIEEGMGPGPENTTEQPSDTEYSGDTPPPDGDDDDDDDE